MAYTKIYQPYFKVVVFNIMNNLYHASENKRLKLLQPQRTLSNDKYIGDFVFATSNYGLAIMYLATRGQATLINPSRSKPNIIICSNEESYLKKDKGGAIYEVSAREFIQSPQTGLTDYEMVSTKPVDVISKTIFDSSIKAMLYNGIEIRFTDKLTFDRLIGNKNQADLIQEIKLFKA